MASKPINIRWITTGSSQSCWKSYITSYNRQFSTNIGLTMRWISILDVIDEDKSCNLSYNKADHLKRNLKIDNLRCIQVWKKFIYFCAIVQRFVKLYINYLIYIQNRLYLNITAMLSTYCRNRPCKLKL